MTKDSVANLTKAQKERERVMALLDEAEASDTKGGHEPGDFENLFEASIKERDFKVGDVVQGTVVEVQTDYVLVDINYKSEGLIPINEFRMVEGVRSVKPDDVVEVYIDRVENENGMVVLSKDKAEILRAWDEISQACEKDQLVEGTVIAKVKGGLSVDIGVKAFLPGSQIDSRPVKNLDKYIGKKLKFKIIKFNKKRGNIVLSRRASSLEKSARTPRAETLDNLQEGMIVTGTVKNITEYGAFIDLGGMDGLLHITDMSLGPHQAPKRTVRTSATKSRSRSSSTTASANASRSASSSSGRSVGRRRETSTRSASRSKARSCQPQGLRRIR